MPNAVIIHEDDSVVIAIEEIAKGEVVSLKTSDKVVNLFKARNDIPVYHKIALKHIKKGQPILKYGEHIGQASEDIEIGSHVHEHNVESVREDLHV